MINPLVSITCITFNHAPYIKACLDGFLMQKTNFDYEIIIHDDASTDGTNNIIKEYEKKYPNIIYPIYQKENQYSKGIRPSWEFNLPRLRGKYIAACEGDDYWTDPYKLQKQVDFLERNPDYGLVHTELDHHYIKTGRYIKNHWKKAGVTNQSGNIFESLLIGRKSMIYACTVCFRAEYVKENKEFNDILSQNFIMGDTPLWLHIALKSKIGYLPETTAVRNVLPFSATQGRSFNDSLKFNESGWKVFKYFEKIRPIDIKEKKIEQNRFYLRQLDLCFRYKGDLNIFDKYYSLLDNEFKNKMLIMKRNGIKFKYIHLIVLIIIKVYNKTVKIRNR